MYALGFSVSAVHAPVPSATQGNGQSFSVTLTANNEFDISGASGMITVTIAGSDDYDGSYAVDVDDISTGPIEVISVQAAGPNPLRAGDVVSITPALWLYEGDAPTRTWAILADGVAVATSTEPSLTVPVGIEGTTVQIREQVDNMQTGLSVSLSSTLPTPAANPALTRYFEHDGAFNVQTPAPVMGATDKEFLLFIAEEVDAGANGQVSTIELLSGVNRFTADYNFRFFAEGNLGANYRTNSDIWDARGQRVAALVHVKMTATGEGDGFLNSSFVEGTGTPTWTYRNAGRGPLADTGFQAGAEAMGIFSDASLTSGKLWRIAIWPNPGAIDIQSAALREAFVNSTGDLLTPAASHALLGTPTIDWHAQATNAAAGGHDGSLGPLTVNTAPTIGDI